MFYIYILYSERADRYYIGHTEDPDGRVYAHNHSERATFTSKYRPWSLVALFECSSNRSQALQAERFIKRQKSRKFIEILVRGDNLTGKLAQLDRVPHVRD